MCVRLKGKGIAHKHCTPVNKVVSRRVPVNNADTAINAYQRETIKWMAGGESQASHCESGSLQISKGRRQNDPYGNGL